MVISKGLNITSRYYLVWFVLCIPVQLPVLLPVCGSLTEIMLIYYAKVRVGDVPSLSFIKCFVLPRPPPSICLVLQYYTCCCSHLILILLLPLNCMLTSVWRSQWVCLFVYIAFWQDLRYFALVYIFWWSYDTITLFLVVTLLYHIHLAILQACEGCILCIRAMHPATCQHSEMESMHRLIPFVFVTHNPSPKEC